MMNFLETFDKFIMDFLLPSELVALFCLLTGIFTFWYGVKYKYRPSRIQGLAVFSLGVAYTFTVFGIGYSELRHVFIRVGLVWVVLSIFMDILWRLRESR